MYTPQMSSATNPYGTQYGTQYAGYVDPNNLYVPQYVPPSLPYQFVAPNISTSYAAGMQQYAAAGMAMGPSPPRALSAAAPVFQAPKISSRFIQGPDILEPTAALNAAVKKNHAVYLRSQDADKKDGKKADEDDDEDEDDDDDEEEEEKADNTPTPIEIPRDFICPINDCVFSDPVVCADGHTYERCGIEEWLSHHNTSPMTNEVVPNRQVVVNFTFKKVIDRWMQENLTSCAYAQYMRDIHCVQYLCRSKDLDVNKGDDQGLTPLHFAVADPGSREIVSMLLTHPGLDINKPDSSGATALMRACHCGQVESVRLLLAKSACRVNQQSKYGSTALLVACWHGHTDCVQALMARSDTDPTMSDINGRGPLTGAAEHNEVIRNLIEGKRAPGSPTIDAADKAAGKLPASAPVAASAGGASASPVVPPAAPKTSAAVPPLASSSAPAPAPMTFASVAASQASGPVPSPRERGPPLASASAPADAAATPDAASASAAVGGPVPAASAWALPAATAPLAAAPRPKPQDMLAAALAAMNTGKLSSAKALPPGAAKASPGASAKPALSTPAHASAHAPAPAPAPSPAAAPAAAVPSPQARSPASASASTPSAAAPARSPAARLDPVKEGRALVSATKRGDLPGVQALLAGGADANFCDAADEENGAIYWAGVKGKTSVLRCLLENGGDVNLPNRKGNTVLIMSSLFNHIDTVALELQKGADPNITNNDGWSPLMLACEKGNNEIIASLLRFAGINVNSLRRDGSTALSEACKHGHAETVRMLVTSRGIETNRCVKGDWTPLHIAVEKGHQQVVRVLLSDPSVDRHLPNAKGKTPLQTATDKGHTSIADMLRR